MNHGRRHRLELCHAARRARVLCSVLVRRPSPHAQPPSAPARHSPSPGLLLLLRGRVDLHEASGVLCATIDQTAPPPLGESALPEAAGASVVVGAAVAAESCVLLMGGPPALEALSSVFAAPKQAGEQIVAADDDADAADGGAASGGSPMGGAAAAERAPPEPGTRPNAPPRRKMSILQALDAMRELAAATADQGGATGVAKDAAAAAAPPPV